MKRYFVIKKLSANNGHLNEQDLLPASCKLITGVAVSTTVKKEADAINSTEPLAFPQNLIKNILASDKVADLFYSYMRTRQSADESKAFFESNILPGLVNALSGGIKYPCLTDTQQNEFTDKLTDLLTGGSDQPVIDWEQRFADLKVQNQNTMSDFLESAFGMNGFDPEIIIEPGFIELLYDPGSRTYGLEMLTDCVYYFTPIDEYSEPYSSVSRTINTYGNSIMQGYDQQFNDLQQEKKAYEQAETQGLAHYLFTDVGIFVKGQELTNFAYARLIASETLSFIYQNKASLFIRPAQKYQRPEPYECGSLSLLVNGNSFLLCDYILTANRKIKHLSKEIIPFSEPLDVNSSLQTVFKSNLKSGVEPLNIRIYIEYEDFKEPLAEVDSQIQEAMP